MMVPESGTGLPAAVGLGNRRDGARRPPSPPGCPSLSPQSAGECRRPRPRELPGLGSGRARRMGCANGARLRQAGGRAGSVMAQGGAEDPDQGPNPAIRPAAQDRIEGLGSSPRAAGDLRSTRSHEISLTTPGPSPDTRALGLVGTRGGASPRPARRPFPLASRAGGAEPGGAARGSLLLGEGPDRGPTRRPLAPVHHHPQREAVSTASSTRRSRNGRTPRRRRGTSWVSTRVTSARPRSLVHAPPALVPAPPGELIGATGDAAAGLRDHERLDTWCRGRRPSSFTSSTRPR